MSLTFVKRDEAASHLPADAKRVEVREKDGTIRWKTMEEVLESDAICFKNGRPMTMKAHPGRPNHKLPQLVPPPGSGSQGMDQVVDSEVARNFSRKQRAVTQNHLFKQIIEDPYDDKILALIMKELAEEAAALKFERKRADQTGRDAIALSVRRVNTLHQISDTWFKRREQLASKSVDLKSPTFRRLFLYIVETFMECMDTAGITDTTAANVQLALSRLFKQTDWVEGAKEAMRA